MGPNLASKIPNINTRFQTYLPKPVMKSIFVLNTNEIEVEKIVNQLENKMCIGYDGIRLDIIKKVIKSIAQPLAYLVNLSIETGVVPDDLKIGMITPLHKAGSKEDITNYRPISILPAFSKIFQKVIVNRLTDFIVSHINSKSI